VHSGTLRFRFHPGIVTWTIPFHRGRMTSLAPRQRRMQAEGRPDRPTMCRMRACCLQHPSLGVWPQDAALEMSANTSSSVGIDSSTRPTPGARCRGQSDSTHCQLFGVLALMTLPLLYLIVQDVLLDHFVCVDHSLGCSPGGNPLHRAALKEGDDWMSVRAVCLPSLTQTHTPLRVLLASELVIRRGLSPVPQRALLRAAGLQRMTTLVTPSLVHWHGRREKPNPPCGC